MAFTAIFYVYKASFGLLSFRIMFHSQQWSRYGLHIEETMVATVIYDSHES